MSFAGARLAARPLCSSYAPLPLRARRSSRACLAFDPTKAMRIDTWLGFILHEPDLGRHLRRRGGNRNAYPSAPSGPDADKRHSDQANPGRETEHETETRWVARCHRVTLTHEVSLPTRQRGEAVAAACAELATSFQGVAELGRW